ncbi:DUF2911 domain-containing protein [Robiginitalea sp.]|uniref:DUF2911 domain-containing protein n=1 Tax=Robiginitalea sp. TaxID=1902411 RepID=UPI003C790615
MPRSVFTLLLILISWGSHAQYEAYPYPSLSPKGKIIQNVGYTLIEIEYERPAARNRKVFGGLVPWNKLWRTGAGNCTTISFDTNVVVGGQKIEAGKYALLTKPGETEWTVILNKDTTLYGTSAYDSKKDVAQIVTTPRSTERFYETLNFDIEILPNDARIFLSWANIQIGFDVETTTDEALEKWISEELLTQKNKDSDIYAGAAEYWLYRGENLNDALKLADIAIELDTNNGWARSLKIKLYEQQKRYEDAIAEIQKSLQNVESREFEDQREKENELQQLRSELERIRKLKEQ